MKKKILALILAGVLAISAFALVSCGGDDTVDSDTETAQTEDTTEPENTEPENTEPETTEPETTEPEDTAGYDYSDGIDEDTAVDKL